MEFKQIKRNNAWSKQGDKQQQHTTKGRKKMLWLKRGLKSNREKNNQHRD
jgi:agmatine/peptidylarginine deiminase